MYNQVLEFWFSEIEEALWWKKDDEFDQLILSRFGQFHLEANAGELNQWRETPHGSLAEIIVLDQFSRNMYRDTQNSFASDALALVLAQVAISKGFDIKLPARERSFVYLPFMHSESRLIHQQALSLYQTLGNPQTLDFALKHKVIIDEFGRYPHRNDILGRQSTPEELEFLKQPNSSF